MRRKVGELLLGVRLWAEHQPQRVTRKRPAETFHDLGVSLPLRLVCDTAALRPLEKFNNLVELPENAAADCPKR